MCIELCDISLISINKFNVRWEEVQAKCSEVRRLSWIFNKTIIIINYYRLVYYYTYFVSAAWTVAVPLKLRLDITAAARCSVENNFYGTLLSLMGIKTHSGFRIYLFSTIYILRCCTHMYYILKRNAECPNKLPLYWHAVYLHTRIHCYFSPFQKLLLLFFFFVYRFISRKKKTHHILYK